MVDFLAFKVTTVIDVSAFTAVVDVSAVIVTIEIIKPTFEGAVVVDVY